MIKAIIFDWGGVLIDYPGESLMEYCSNTLGIKKELFRKTYSQYGPDFQKGIIKENELWKKICGELKINSSLSSSLWRDAVEELFTDKAEMFDLIRGLKKNGYKIGFLSNTEMPAMQYFFDNNYDKYFDTSIFSCAEAKVKPEKEIYLMTLEGLEVQPQEAIFIDDEQKNIDGAIRLGINSIFFKSPNQIKKELMRFSVKIE